MLALHVLMCFCFLKELMNLYIVKCGVFHVNSVFLMKENLLIIEMGKCSFSLILLYVFILDIVLLHHPFFMFLVKLYIM